MILTRRYLIAATVAAAAAASGPAPLLAQNQQTPVVASFSVLGDMVARIGGDRVALTTLVGPDGDAHVYQPTPDDARAVSSAALLVANGLAFEGWLDRLVEAAEFKGRRVVATKDITPIEFEEAHGDEHDEHAEGEHHDEEHAHGDDHADEKHAHGHGHDHDDEKHADAHGHDHDDEKHADAHGHDHDDEKHAHGDDHGDEKHADAHGHHGHDHGAEDPHAWHDLNNGILYAGAIAEALAEADPEGADAYRAAAAAYIAELRALDAEIREIIGALPEERRTVVTPHDAFGYFAEAYGVEFLAPQGFSTESEASAADVARLIDQIRAQGIDAVFVENISDTRLIEQIARETGARIGGTLFSDALSGPDGPASTYIDMMRHNATTLARALSAS